jgi:hypothetical protein
LKWRAWRKTQIGSSKTSRRKVMFQATDRAVDVLRQMLAQVDKPETYSLRLTLGQDGPVIVPDEVGPSDVALVQDRDERPLMVANPPIAAQLDGRTLDFNSASSQLVVT